MGKNKKLKDRDVHGDNTPARVLLKRFFNDYFKKQNKQVLIAILCMVVTAGSTAALAWMMQPVLDKVFVGKQTNLLLPIALAVVFLSIIKGAATYIHNVIMKTVGQRITSDRP